MTESAPLDSVEQELQALAEPLRKMRGEIETDLEKMDLAHLAKLSALRQEKERMVEDHKIARKVSEDKVRRIDRTLKSLGAPDPPKPRKAKPVWRPNETYLDRVEVYVTGHDGVTHTQTAEALNMDKETTRRCLLTLRQEEKIRVAGIDPTHRGKPKVWKGMNTNGNGKKEGQRNGVAATA